MLKERSHVQGYLCHRLPFVSSHVCLLKIQMVDLSSSVIIFRDKSSKEANKILSKQNPFKSHLFVYLVGGGLTWHGKSTEVSGQHI